MELISRTFYLGRKFSHLEGKPSVSGSRIFESQFQVSIETKMNILKLLIRIQQYNATDFQGWSKMTED